MDGSARDGENGGKWSEELGVCGVDVNCEGGREKEGDGDNERGVVKNSFSASGEKSRCCLDDLGFARPIDLNSVHSWWLLFAALRRLFIRLSLASFIRLLASFRRLVNLARLVGDGCARYTLLAASLLPITALISGLSQGAGGLFARKDRTGAKQSQVSIRKLVRRATFSSGAGEQ